LDQFVVEPSQGSHFFHNLISLKMGYMHIKKTTETEFILWDWLKKQRPRKIGTYLKQVSFSDYFQVLIDGKTSRGVLLKPS
jgi:hypothetical protein